MYRVAVGIPTITNFTGLDALIHQLYEQAGVEVALYLVANSPGEEQHCEKWKRWGAKVWTPGSNAGVAKSWNQLMKMAFDDGHDLVVILNDDVSLDDDQVLKTFSRQAPGIIWTPNPAGWWAFMSDPEVVKRVGWFDESLWPAYREDNDYHWRCRLAGIPVEKLEVQISHSPHSSQKDRPALRHLLEIARPRIDQYYIDKWGDLPPHEHYREPFNGGRQKPWTGQYLLGEHLRAVGIRKRRILITGLARSGTTLVAQVINSAINACILQEPFNCYQNHGFIWTGKLRQAAKVIEYYSTLHELENSDFDLVGVKEVFQNLVNQAWRGVDDHVLVVIRDPVEIAASQVDYLKRDFNEALRSFEEFKHWTELLAGRLGFISFPRFLEDPLGEINRAAKGAFQLHGNLELKSGLGFGDYRALHSSRIAEPNDRRHVLSPEQIQQVEEKFGEFFRGLL